MIKKAISDFLIATVRLECEECPLMDKDCEAYDTCEEAVLKYYMCHFEELPDAEEIRRLNMEALENESYN